MNSGKRVRGITATSGEVEAGMVFVAIRGESVDGHEFVADAVERGAVAVVVEQALPSEHGIPVIEVPSTRRALATLAAAWHGNPAQSLAMVGITGTVGKTSTLSMLESILATAGRSVGSVGSLGVRIRGEQIGETGFTAPDPLQLHRSLAQVMEEGCDLALMEATSHALVQDRIAGIRFDLGILTNIIPLEHQDYHGSFRGYVEAKRRFFDHLGPCAPLVYSTDNRAAQRIVHDYAVEAVGCGTARTAVVRIEPDSMAPDGTSLTLNVRRPIPRLDDDPLPPGRFPLKLPLLGRSNVRNAAMAATAAFCLGAESNAVSSALARLTPPRRRMQVVYSGRFLLLDDSVGHPDSISAVFQVVEQLAPRRLHIAFAIRGQRGPRINRQSARALAIWCERNPPATLVLTRSEEAADERNRVEGREHHAFCRIMREGGVPFTAIGRLDRAVEEVLEAAAEGDLVLLLGAQGMDTGQEIARRWLEARGYCGSAG